MPEGILRVCPDIKQSHFNGKSLLTDSKGEPVCQPMNFAVKNARRSLS
jgi:hypothetical protein